MMNESEKQALIALDQLFDLTSEDDWPMIHDAVRDDVANLKYGSAFEAAYKNLVNSKLKKRVRNNNG